MNKIERIGLTLFIAGLYISLFERVDSSLILSLLPNHFPILAIPFIALGVILFILY